MKKNIYDDSWYESQILPSYQSAKKILAILHSITPPLQSVVDFGCGRGAWLKASYELGSTSLCGLDGTWNNQSTMIIPNIDFFSTDFNQSIKLNKKFDLAISVEVAEHLSPEISDIFINSITEASDLVIFSAAYSNQGGTNHLNENKHTYWAEKFIKNNFLAFDIFREKCWSDSEIQFYYAQNCFLYVRKFTHIHDHLISKGLKPIENIDFMNAIHPELWTRASDEINQLKKAQSRSLPKKILGKLLKKIKQ